MSINTTNTSDRLGIDPRASSPAQEESRQKHEGVSALMAALPDPAVIAKLANEFFAALPGAASPDAAGSLPALNDVDLRGISTAGPPPTVPDYPREMFSFPAVPNAASALGQPQAASSPTTGVWNESDFHAIATSLAVAPATDPESPVITPLSAIHGSAPSFLDKEKAGPLNDAPQIPSGGGPFSLPGVPSVPSSPPTSPPSGADMASVPPSRTGAAAGVPSPPYPAPSDAIGEGRTDPWALAPDFAELNDGFSFPRVPGASLPGFPESQFSKPGLSALQSESATIPDQPPTDKAGLIPGVPESSPSLAFPEEAVDSFAAEKAAYPNAAAKLPTVGEMFSFPGVPGVQSPPGVPVLLSAIPSNPPTEADLGAGTTALTGVRPGAIPLSPGTIPDAKSAGPRPATSLPGFDSVELGPDLAPKTLGVDKRPFDPRLIRQDFPILQERVNGRPLIWLDNAATTQKPNAVIDRLSYFYRHENSNIHRAAHTLAARATDAYESAREKTRRFLNASSTREIIFVRGTTEGINLVAQAWGRRNVQKDDEVVITWLEHHANIVPWQMLCAEKGARLRVAPVNDRGEVSLEEYEKLLGPRTRIVSFSHVSNALGTITPAREMVEMAHRHGARVLVDGAQAVSHMRVDVQALDCDFYVFSGHKIFGPTGIGAVYGKLDVLETMPPWQGGGNMIVDVTFEKTTYQVAPGRFEAGTGNIADAVGLGAALDYVEQVGMESIAAYEHDLLIYATAGLLTVPGLKLIGTARDKAGVLSFILDDVRTEDVGSALSQEGIAVRAGHHCAQPILRRMGVEATVRPSLAFYNTYEDVDALVSTLLRLQAGREHRKAY
jgi:cysteine desulfurase / selenocysteine lyase